MFYGDPVQTYWISHNGVLTFSSPTGLPGANTNLPSTTLPDKSICAFWDHQGSESTYGGYGQGEVLTVVFGTQPNRQYWISFKSWPLGNTIENMFSIVLEETSNNIYIVDQFDFSNYDNLTATVGIQNNQTEYHQYGSDNIYPNPTQDMLHFQYDALRNESISFAIENQLGQQMSKGEALSNQLESLDVSDYPVGIYLLQIVHGDQSGSQLFQVNR